MVLTLYFSKRQLQSMSIDTQTRGLNDLGEKYLKIVERAMFYICHPPHTGFMQKGSPISTLVTQMITTTYPPST